MRVSIFVVAGIHSHVGYMKYSVIYGVFQALLWAEPIKISSAHGDYTPTRQISNTVYFFLRLGQTFSEFWNQTGRVAVLLRAYV